MEILINNLKICINNWTQHNWRISGIIRKGTFHVCKFLYKKFFFPTLLFILNITFLYPQEPQQPDAIIFPLENSLKSGISISMGSNLVLWSFNRFVTQADYGRTSLNSVKTNITNPWTWDQDNFAVNHLGHPYQGSIYYSSARSAGADPWTSLAVTVLGSVTWEEFMETETPSYNDLIVTTFGGAAIGEIFYRLSEVLIYGEKGTRKETGLALQAAGTVLSPASSLNRLLLKDIHRPETKPINGWTSVGGGYSHINLNFINNDESKIQDQGFSSLYDLNFSYGDPFSSTNLLPYDFFSLSSSVGIHADNFFLSLFTEGLIWGKLLYSSRNEDARHQLGLYLHYDFILNRIINLGANSTGLGWVYEVPLGKGWNFQSFVHLGFVFLGASDIIFLKYEDLYLEPPDYERRNYSLSIGDTSKISLKLNWNDRLYLDWQYRFYNLYILDSTVPEKGTTGKEFVGVGVFTLRYVIHDPWYIGIATHFYHKETFYENYEDFNEIMGSYALIAGFSF